MKNGDISNETPPRIIVIIDAIAKSEVTEKTRLLLSTVTERKLIGLDNLALSQLWNITNKFGLSVELAAFETEHWSAVQLESVMEKLERRGGNPFNYAELYSDIDEFIAELPYRNNLKGVIDIPERVMRYGSKGIELKNL